MSVGDSGTRLFFPSPNIFLLLFSILLLVDWFFADFRRNENVIWDITELYRLLIYTLCVGGDLPGDREISANFLRRQFAKRTAFFKKREKKRKFPNEAKPPVSSTPNTQRVDTEECLLGSLIQRHDFTREQSCISLREIHLSHSRAVMYPERTGVSKS